MIVLAIPLTISRMRIKDKTRRTTQSYEYFENITVFSHWVTQSENHDYGRTKELAKARKLQANSCFLDAPYRSRENKRKQETSS